LRKILYDYLQECPHTNQKDNVSSISIIVAQNKSNDYEEIKKIFYQQGNDRNNGDISAFMQAY